MFQPFILTKVVFWSQLCLPPTADSLPGAEGEIALKFWSQTDPKGGGARMIPCMYWGSRYIRGIKTLVGHRRCLSVLFQRCITIRKPTWGLSEWWLKYYKKECDPNHCRQPYMPDCIKDAPSWSRSPMRRFSDAPSIFTHLQNVSM